MEPASSATDTAALQLEALQVLLLLFPLPLSQVSSCTQVMLAWMAYTNAASPLLFLALSRFTLLRTGWSILLVWLRPSDAGQQPSCIHFLF